MGKSYFRIRPTSKHKHLLAFIAAMMAITLTAGCSSPGQPQGGTEQSGEKMAPSLTAMFDQYLAKDTLSTFERDVLQRAKKNGKISAEDYENAHRQQVSCVEAAGWKPTYKKLPNGLYQSLSLEPLPNSQEQVDKYMEASSQCSEGVSKVIEALYGVQQGNPELLSDPYEAAVACLRKAKLVEANYTGKKLEDALTNDSAQSKLPFDAEDGTVQGCFAGAGLAVNLG